MNNELMTQQNVLGDMDALDRVTRFAELMAGGKATLPECLQGNSSDCLAVCLQAQAWGMNPYAVAQKTHLIKGKLGYEAQLVNAVINRHAPIEGRLQVSWSDGWERVTGKHKKMKGNKGEYLAPGWNDRDEDGLWAEVSATVKGEDQPRLLRLMLCQAWPRHSTLWATDPKQQLAYAAIKRWARLYCPDVILGIYTPEELEVREAPKEKDVTPASRVAAVLADGEPVSARKESDSPPARSVTGQYIEDKQQTTQDSVTEAPENRADAMKQRVRKSMRENAQVVDRAPNDSDRLHRDMCLKAISACTTAKELAEAGELISGAHSALHADFVEEVRAAYRVKKEAVS